MDLLRDIIIEVGGSAWKWDACAIFEDGRRFDLAAKLKKADKLFALDPTIVDGSADTYLQAADALKVPRAGVKKAESVKVAHYHDCPDTHQLQPFAVGHQIELGDAATEFVTVLATEVASRAQHGEEPSQGAINRASRHIMQRIGSTVMRCNARIIDEAIMYGDGLPGHNASNRAVHSSWEHGECVYPAGYGG